MSTPSPELSGRIFKFLSSRGYTIYYSRRRISRKQFAEELAPLLERELRKLAYDIENGVWHEQTGFSEIFPKLFSPREIDRIIDDAMEKRILYPKK